MPKKVFDQSFLDWLTDYAHDQLNETGHDFAEAFRASGTRGEPRIAVGDFVDHLFGTKLRGADLKFGRKAEHIATYKAFSHDDKSEALHQAVCRAFSVKRRGNIYL